MIELGSEEDWPRREGGRERGTEGGWCERRRRGGFGGGSLVETSGKEGGREGWRKGGMEVFILSHLASIPPTFRSYDL